MVRQHSLKKGILDFNLTSKTHANILRLRD